MSAVELLAAIIQEQSPEDIWQDSPLAGYRRLGNTNRGVVGEEFVCRYLGQHGIEASREPRTAATDIRVGRLRCELKTASLGANGTFQFNHIRLDRDYDCLLCLGLCPHDVLFGAWRKGVVAEGGAGSLVRMAEGQAVTYKLTKKLEDLRRIQELPPGITEILESLG